MQRAAPNRGRRRCRPAVRDGSPRAIPDAGGQAGLSFWRGRKIDFFFARADKKNESPSPLPFPWIKLLDFCTCWDKRKGIYKENDWCDDSLAWIDPTGQRDGIHTWRSATA